jgi:ketosteroid isomerase-like protein
VEATKAGDIEVIVSLAADDVVVMSPNDSTLYGKAEWKDWLEEYFQVFRVTAFTEPERSIVVHGDFATECTTYMIAIAPVGGASRIRDDGRFLTIWKRQPDGVWKIWQTMWNSTKPIGIGTNRYMWRFMQKKTRTKR